MQSKTTRTIVGFVASLVIVFCAFKIVSGIRVLRADINTHPPRLVTDYVVPSTEDFQPSVVVPNRFPTITEFDVKTGAEADSELNPTELVLGVELNGEARAYPINMLTGPQREVINDEVGGSPIAATW